MRGSVYYQTALLTKLIFKEGAKKEQRLDKEHDYYKCVASFKTMETYRNVWNNFFNYLREHWKLKNCEHITEEHVKSYFEYKIEYYPSKQYAEKISAALGKLEVALNKYSKSMDKNNTVYNFNIRQNILNNARNFKLVADNYHNRTYENVEEIINNLSTLEHQIAAKIQLEGGARVEGVSLINKQQLKGFETDNVTKHKKGVIETKEKGGKIGNVQICEDTYNLLVNFFKETQKTFFKITYQQYASDIKEACKLTNVVANGSHGFRWTFAKNRVREYQRHGYSYEQSIQAISWEMKHFRASITEHYL